jgi:short-subunit dehydrogenase
MRQIVAITGASAGVGRAAARAFAAAGYDVGLIARDPERLAAAATEVRQRGRRAVVAMADVAEASAVEAAASAIEAELGPIDVWVNDAMVTVFAPVSEIASDEFRRVTEVTYLGTVHGTIAALRRMRPRNKGKIIQVGSALSYRAIPLQSAYCGAKFAIRGFTDSLRTELMHDGSNVHVTMVQLPAINTPQFDWALNRMPRRPQPVPPIYQPEVAARAILLAARSNRREVFVGAPTWQAIIANRFFPGLLDRYLARTAYAGQMRSAAANGEEPANLEHPVPGPYAAHGSFTSRARDVAWDLWLDRHRAAFAVGSALLAGFWLATRSSGSPRRS